jgi:hypothetical protein
MAELVYFSILALAALVVFALSVAIVRRYPPVGIGLVSLILVTVWDVPNPPPIFAFSGLTVYPADAIAFVLLVAAILEAPQLKENMRGWLVPWMFFGVLIAVSLLRGVAAFEFGAAVNEARIFLHFFFAMTWVLAVRPDRLKLHTVSLVLGWVLVLVAVYHGVRYGVGGAVSSASIGEDVVQTGRVLYGGQAAALLLCAATVLLSPSDSALVRPQFATASSVVFLGLVVLAQHRSVWGAGALGVITVLIWSGRRQARNRVFVALIIGVWLILIAWFSGILDSLVSELFGTALDTGTYQWRTSSWQSLISEAIAKGPGVVVGGEPFGSGYSRLIYNGRWTNLSAHNWYVTIFLRLGIIGLITLAGMLIAALVKSRSKPAWSTFVLAAALAYSWGYQFDWYLAPWLGAAMTAALGDARGRLGGVDHAVLGTSNDAMPRRSSESSTPRRDERSRRVRELETGKSQPSVVSVRQLATSEPVTAINAEQR